MSTKPTRKELTHERILDAASRALRRVGYDGVAVAEVMKDAGLTHGGFYAHFDSREAMLAEAIQRAGQEKASLVRQDMAERLARGARPLRALIEAYLSETHLQAVDSGCPVAALASEMSRQQDAVRDASCERVRRFIKAVQQTLPPDVPPDSALVIVSTLVGALQLARVLGPGRQSKAILNTTVSSLVAQYDKPDPTH
jgi:AcrR family transcriptional regulator